MDLLDPRIAEYLNSTNGRSPSPLDEMEAYAKENGFPIIGPLVGRVLQQLVLISGAKRVFELGSGYGYSAIWMGMVLPDDGRVICTDGDPENERRAKEHIERAGLQSKIEFRVGDALECFAKEPGPFDLILNDIDKEGYPDTIKPVKEKLRPGGIFVTDNLLWSGRILQKTPEHESTQGVIEFTKRICSDPDFLTTIIPIRDGIAVAVKR
jgi:predicted O-methyltransferase YrrM